MLIRLRLYTKPTLFSDPYLDLAFYTRNLPLLFVRISFHKKVSYSGLLNPYIS